MPSIFEVLVEDSDMEWERVEANGPRSAAEIFAENYEMYRHAYPIAAGVESLTVLVRTPTGGCARFVVEGEIVRQYNARFVDALKYGSFEEK